MRPPCKDTIWGLIGGKVADNGLSGNPNYENSCAVRMSYALNYSGDKIPRSDEDGVTGSGKDGNWYFYRVADLESYLEDTYGKPAEYSPSTWKTDLNGQTGILMFQAHYSNATGHFELFDGKQLVNGAAHDLSNDSNKVFFWPFK